MSRTTTIIIVAGHELHEDAYTIVLSHHTYYILSYILHTAYYYHTYCILSHQLYPELCALYSE